MAFNIRYRFKNKSTGEIVSYEDGTSLLVTKKGALCTSPSACSRQKVSWSTPSDNLILEIATSKLNGSWFYEPIPQPKERFTLSHRLQLFQRKVKALIK